MYTEIVHIHEYIYIHTEYLALTCSYPINSNDHDFFGTAIGGSLGATRRVMHDIVAFTRAMVRDDRPVHLLGIG